MSSVAERSLALNRSLIESSVRVPAQFFGVPFAKTALDEDGGQIEYAYTITGFREPGEKVTAEWTLTAPDEDDVFVNRNEGRVLGRYTLCSHIFLFAYLFRIYSLYRRLRTTRRIIGFCTRDSGALDSHRGCVQRQRRYAR